MWSRITSVSVRWEVNLMHYILNLFGASVMTALYETSVNGAMASSYYETHLNMTAINYISIWNQSHII